MPDDWGEWEWREADTTPLDFDAVVRELFWREHLQRSLRFLEECEYLEPQRDALVAGP